MSHSVGVVIPAFQPEVSQLATYIDAIREEVQPTAIRVELDDPDGTHEAIGEHLDAEVAIAPRRRGKGLAITSGFEALDTDMLAFVDADGATSATEVDRVIEPLRAKTAEFTIGTRRHPQSEIEGEQPVSRRVLSGTFVRLARVVTGLDLTDFQCGAKAMTADTWGRLRGAIYEAGFGWDLEVLWLAKCHDIPIEEVPIRWIDRPGSTVPPVRTAISLGYLLARVATARSRSRTRVRTHGSSLLERLDDSVVG